MPTYEDLRSHFEESEFLQGAARAASDIASVRGFTLDLNPAWTFLDDLEHNLMLPPMSRYGPFRYRLDDFLHFNIAVGTDPVHCVKTRHQGYRRRNLKRKVRDWQSVAETYGFRSPVVLTIVHRPLRTPLKGRAEERDEQEELVRLIGIAREFGPSVRIEERPAARLAVASGDGIQAPNSGTLGGILDDPNGISYGVTCAHVANNTYQAVDTAGQAVGTCVADIARVNLAGTTVCDPILLAMPNPYPGNGPQINMLDCALIRMQVPVTRPQIAGIAQSLTPGQDVTLTGAKTHTTHHKLGSLCISYCFSRGGQDYCFRDSIELIPQPWGPIGGAIGRMMTTVPVPGDSGAWVLTDDQPPAWAGLFFGEDGSRGFAIRASWVHDWAENATQTKLSP
jgi:hypothetical protein